jgi:hypothetical protein
MILAAIRAAKKEGAPEVEVIFGDGSTVRIPPDRPPISRLRNLM